MRQRTAPAEAPALLRRACAQRPLRAPVAVAVLVSVALAVALSVPVPVSLALPRPLLPWPLLPRPVVPRPLLPRPVRRALLVAPVAVLLLLAVPGERGAAGGVSQGRRAPG